MAGPITIRLLPAAVALCLTLAWKPCLASPQQGLRKDEKPQKLEELIEKNQIESAEEELQRAVESRRPSAELIESLALLYITAKKPAQVVSLSNRFLTGHEEDLALRLAALLVKHSFLETADELLEAFLEKMGFFSWKLTSSRASILFDLGRYRQVVDLLGRTPKSQQDQPARHYLLSLSYQQLGQGSEALTQVRRARHLKPDPAYFNTEGILLLQRNDIAGAEQIFQEGIRQFPNASQLYVSQSRIYSKEGDYYRVKSLLEKAIEVDPNYGEAYVYLARLFYLVGDWQSFRPAIKKAIDLLPTHYLGCYYFGQLLLLESGDRAEEKAFEFFKKSVELNRSFSAAYIACGQILSRQGQWKQALDFYGQAVKHDPHNSRGYYLIAQVYRALGRVDEAKETLEKYRKLSGAYESRVDADHLRPSTPR